MWFWTPLSSLNSNVAAFWQWAQVSVRGLGFTSFPRNKSGQTLTQKRALAKHAFRQLFHWWQRVRKAWESHDLFVLVLIRTYASSFWKVLSLFGWLVGVRGVCVEGGVIDDFLHLISEYLWTLPGTGPGSGAAVELGCSCPWGTYGRVRVGNWIGSYHMMF